MLDIETIKSNGLCSGCGLCAGIRGHHKSAICMEVSDKGFHRPVATDRICETDLRLINQVCPGLNIEHDSPRQAEDYDPIWGPLLKARLGWSTDQALRRNASSGGALSAILLHLLESGEIDYVLQTAASSQLPLRNALVTSTGREDVYEAAGSRYAPSSPLEDIEACLSAPGRFAFVGKPCDVAGLRRLSKFVPSVDQKIPIMIAFMCAGVPSYRGTSAVLKQMGVADESDVVSFRFRGDGWPGFATAVLSDGSERRLDYNSSWGAILNRHLQFRCKICPDGTGEFADITCADGWYLDEAGRPVFDEREGRSVILTRTEKGEACVLRAISSGHVQAEQVDLATLKAMQPFQARRKGHVLPRLAAMALVGRKLPRFRGLALRYSLKGLRAKEIVRSFGGTLRRLLTNRSEQV
ncbi:MAG: Coenzyme F420 hydrogenase/dehydrogenase, beta subunit C-terminal domain [Erythrobacter sp.]|uniref:Coenzyme F420 hydrogenase/dehydrogenase, beta subunit C-terminal domain n=1 Tax=Erythrobacter sp. TaxID=1042 RepID=UPI0026107910|nr:Coenzyme F420 hydrogenase/dehydrogenase, beta subunit C-terminal domain [Erythrobacter sp.]MDJ0979375.1 Coenzyme F420 hydrogenase/dehydrogenase, beta subunit C-terminal domain [Erythrobacter sp.]